MKSLRESLFDSDLAKKSVPGEKWINSIRQYLYDSHGWVMGRDYDISIYNKKDLGNKKIPVWFKVDEWVIVINMFKKLKIDIQDDLAIEIKSLLESEFKGLHITYWCNYVISKPLICWGINEI